jgi:hypothetical protein
MDAKVLADARAAFPAGGSAITLGAVVHGGECAPEPLVRLPLAMANRHGLIAGATGTGKTKSLQLMAEQFSAAGVPVFLADLKGDLSGMGTAGQANDRITQRATETGWAWQGAARPVEYLSLTGGRGAQLRATISSFGPLLLARVLGLNETQASVLALVFKFSDDQKLPLIDFADLRAVLQYLTSDAGASSLAQYGAMSRATVGVLLREMVELEQMGAGAFLGEPEFELEDLLQVERDGSGLISVLELPGRAGQAGAVLHVHDVDAGAPLPRLPEVGDVEKPKLVFFFDEAHLLVRRREQGVPRPGAAGGAARALEGRGVYFRHPEPEGHPGRRARPAGPPRAARAARVHARRRAGAAAAGAHVPDTPHYDVEKTLTSLGIGEALRHRAHARGHADDAVRDAHDPARHAHGTAHRRRAERAPGALGAGEALRHRGRPRQRARAIAGAHGAGAARARADGRHHEHAVAGAGGGRRARRDRRRHHSPLGRMIAGRVTTQVARGIMGALMGAPTRRRRW